MLFDENDSGDLFGKLANSQQGLFDARNAHRDRVQAASDEADAQRTSTSKNAATALGALGGFASVIPGGQIIGAGLGVLGAIIGLLG